VGFHASGPDNPRLAMTKRERGLLGLVLFKKKGEAPKFRYIFIKRPVVNRENVGKKKLRLAFTRRSYPLVKSQGRDRLESKGLISN